MDSDDWSLLGTGLDVTFDGPPTVGPTTSTDWTHQDHLIVEAEVIQQLISAITSLVAVGTQFG